MSAAAWPLKQRTLPRLGGLIAAAGALLLAWGGWNLLLPERDGLHRYALDTRGPAAQFPALGLGQESGLAVSRYAVSVEGMERPVAHAYVTDSPGLGPVLLAWENQLAEPLLYEQGALPELTQVAQAIREHAGGKRTILGWWDELRRLQVLGIETGGAAGHLGEPLLLPGAWRGEARHAAVVEQRFWGEGLATGGESRYRAYPELLLDGEAQAAARLRALAAGRDALLVVNVADLLKLAALHPQRFGLGYRDFPDTGNLHGMIERVKGWLTEQGHSHYLVERRGAVTLRVYYLTDAASADTLIASLLPFSGGGLVDLTQFELVYQTGSYWVYLLAGSSS